ncbi:MAG: hypothetical protein R6U40_07805 [Desulfobacterales bacterium]
MTPQGRFSGDRCKVLGLVNKKSGNALNPANWKKAARRIRTYFPDDEIVMGMVPERILDRTVRKRR